jgi:hypothetical protein
MGQNRAEMGCHNVVTAGNGGRPERLNREFAKQQLGRRSPSPNSSAKNVAQMVPAHP